MKTLSLLQFVAAFSFYPNSVVLAFFSLDSKLNQPSYLVKRTSKVDAYIEDENKLY
jgi:hypothetical protein